MNKNITTLVIGMVIIIVAIFTGYFIGKSSVDIPEPIRIVEIKWQKGDVVRDTIKVPEPYEVKVTDSIPVFIPADTAKLFAIWQDYYLNRSYDLDFSNDSIGTFKVDVLVNQNKLVSSNSFIRPNIRTIKEKETIYKVPAVQFYGLIGSSLDLKNQHIQLGIDFKQKYMLGVSGLRIDDKNGYTFDLGIKF